MLGLDKLGNLGELMRGAKELQSKLADVQDRLAEKTADGEAGGGMVRVTANGRHEIVTIQIDPAIHTDEDREMLQELIVAAANQALGRTRELAQAELASAFGGMVPPGMMGMMNPGG